MAAIAKVHQMLHLLHGAFLLHGNPRFYSCFIDESLNKDLAGIARVAYSTVWAERIFVCRKRIRSSRGTGLTIASID